MITPPDESPGGLVEMEALKVECWLDYGWCVVERIYDDSTGKLKCMNFPFVTHSRSPEAEATCHAMKERIEAVKS